MDSFFDSRLDIYDQHQLEAIDSAKEFYPFTASLLPRDKGARVLDLGCGTGLELEWYFESNPSARVTGVDLAAGMLAAMRAKFAGRNLKTICGSYFDVALGDACYDAAVSVESLHHFTRDQKTGLYTRLRRALVPGGAFILTDYFAAADEEEAELARELTRLKREQGISDEGFYHFDTPLTVEHEVDALRDAGFQDIEVLGRWASTATLRATA